MSGAEYVARRLAERAAWVAGHPEARALMAIVGPANPRHLLASGAWKRCAFCGQCGRAIADGEPVRVTWVYVGDGGVRAPTCADCPQRSLLERDSDFLDPEPCHGCGRMVAVRTRRGQRKVVACSERCAWTARNRRRATVAAILRRRRCLACNEAFAAPRSDARYCSSACRQRAYRQRATVAQP
jgi:hypothetical protein